MTLLSSRRNIFVLGIMLAAMLSLTMMTMKPASAASCWANSCNGKNPTATGCATNARTLSEVTVYTERVELRYSDACNAAWVRISTGPSYSLCFIGEGYVYNSAGAPAQWVYADDALCHSPGWHGADSHYSNMVSDTTGQTARACGGFDTNADGVMEDTTCTRAV